MVVSVPDDAGRIEDIVMKKMTDDGSRMYHPTVNPIRTKEDRERSKRECYSRLSPPLPACPSAWSAANWPQLPTPPTPCRTPDCAFSPRAPQVENIVDATASSSGPCYGPALRQVENAKENAEIAELGTRPRTRSIARRDGLVIPDSLDISDSKDDECPKVPTSTKSRAPRSSAARKLITDSKSRRESLSALNNDSRHARRQTRNTRSQVQNIEQTSSPACMSPSESRTSSSTHLTSTLPTAARTAGCEGPSAGSVGQLEPSSDSEEEDVEPDTGSSDSGRTCRRRRGTTSPLRDRGGLPRLARPEGCYAARRSPLRGKAGEPA